MKQIVLKAKIIDNNNNLQLDINDHYKIFIPFLKKIKQYVKITIEKWDDEGTAKQNKIFHALVRKYYNSHMFSYSNFFKRYPMNENELKIDIKIRLGKALCEKIKINNDLYYIGVQSWRDMGKFKRMNTIDNLINEMLMHGININNEVMEWTA